MKIINKVYEVGFKRTYYLAYERINQLFKVKFNFFNKKRNYISNEWIKYWKSFNYIKKVYLKKILNIKKVKGTNQFSNKVWWCWLQGEENCPPLQKQCLKSLRNNLKDRDIVVITNKNLYDYIELPENIKKKYSDGIISNTHFSDLVRLQLLIKYGGTWIDSTAYCTGFDKELFDKPLFVYKNLNYIWFANKNKFEQEPMIADNWFITSEIGNPILVAVRDLLFDYWKHYNYVIDYFIFHYFFTLVVNYKYKEEFDNIPLRSHLIPHLLQLECLNSFDEDRYNDIVKQTTFHKLTHKIDLKMVIDDSYYSYILKK